MRITGGSLKGRLLNSPKKSGVRPTTDRLRSSLFSIIGGKIVDSYVLDLFAGTGAFGIESLSRGAKFVAFLDIDTVNLKQNLSNFNISNNVKVFTGDFRTLLKKISLTFDIIFIDPPYEKYRPKDVLNSVRHLCGENTVIIFEERKNTDFNEIDEVFKEIDRRDYSDTQIRIYEVVK
ncbi:16S rRNA (guanine(966)-N(2))-methyltransferase RsmD [Deferribacteraceae bacterium V6Fe1]|nr:16S rRNA (guanine(966)-N(2))-methyltransferase RsmD [Deferribacteraceae bacterium V6Fe1]